jgi:hypothetical protein
MLFIIEKISISSKIYLPNSLVYQGIMHELLNNDEEGSNKIKQ